MKNLLELYQGQSSQGKRGRTWSLARKWLHQAKCASTGTIAHSSTSKQCMDRILWLHESPTVQVLCLRFRA